MSKNNRTERKEDSAEVKVVGVKDNQGTYHTVMLTRIDGNAYHAMQQKGFRGEYIFYTIADAGVVDSHYDPRKLRHEAPYLGRNDVAYALMVGIHDGIIPWDRVVDGSIIDPVDLDEMKNG